MKSLSEGPLASESGTRWWEDCVGQVLYALAARLGPVVDVIDVVSPRYKVRDLVMELEGASPGLSPAVVRAALEELGDRGFVWFPLGALSEPIAEVWLRDRGLVAARMIWPDVGRVLRRITLVTKGKHPMLDVRLETGSPDLDRDLNDAPMRVFVALLVLVDEPREDTPFEYSAIKDRVKRLLLSSQRQRPGRTDAEIVTDDGISDALRWLEKPLGLVRGYARLDNRRVQYWLRRSLPEVRINAGDPGHLDDWMNFRIFVRRIAEGSTVAGFVGWEQMLNPSERPSDADAPGVAR